MYLSSKLSSTNRRMREVLPTAASPMRQTFTFILLTSITSHLALGIPGETRLNVMGALSSGIIDWPRGARPHRNVLRDGEWHAMMYPRRHSWTEAAPMCDEHSDERMKADWR